MPGNLTHSHGGIFWRQILYICDLPNPSSVRSPLQCMTRMSAIWHKEELDKHTCLVACTQFGKKGGAGVCNVALLPQRKGGGKEELKSPFFSSPSSLFPPPPLPLAKRKPERLFKEERRKEREKGGGGGSHCLLASWLMNLSGVCPSSSSSSSPPPSAPPDSTNEIREAFFTAFLCAVT